VKEDTKKRYGSVPIGAKLNYKTRNLRRNPNKRIVSNKVSFDEAESNKLKSHRQRSHENLEHIDCISN